METSNPAPTPFPATTPVSTTTLKQEWMLIAIAGAVVMTFLTIDLVTFPKETGRGEHTPLSILGGFIAAFSHGAWITMDRKRRGRSVGIWRFGAILLGPIVLGLYLVAEYRLRSLYLIPAMLGIYIGVGGIALAVSKLLAK